MISVAHAAQGAAADVALYATPEFWVAAAFFVVVGFVYWKARRTIVGMLDARAAEIRARLDEARKLREDAQAVLADYQRRQRDALKEAEEIVEHARDEADRLRKKAEESLEASIQRRERQAAERIAQAEAQAIAEVRSAAADLAILASRKLLADGLTQADRDRLVEESIRQVPGRLN